MIERLRTQWRRELLYPGLAGMEACWIHPWLALILGNSRETPHVPLVAMLFMLLLALYVTRLLSQKTASLQKQRLVTLMAALLTTLLLLRALVYSQYSLGDLSWLVQFAREISNALQRVPHSLVIFLAGIYLWWRGISLAQRELDLASAGLSFRVGIIAFFWLFLIKVFGSPVDATAFAFIYFFLALIVMGLARVQEVSQSHVGIRSPFNAAWMGILTSATLVVVALNILAAKLISLRTAAVLLQWLRPALLLLGRAAHPVLAVLLDAIFTFLIRVFGALFGGEALESLGLGRLGGQLQELRPTEVTPARPPLILQILKWGFLAFLFVGALTVLAFSVNRARRALDDGREVEHESARESASTDRGLGDTLESRLRRLREGLQAQLGRLRGEEYALTSIRKIYASLVKFATATGFPRRVAETPYEYTATLHHAFPDSADEVVLITDAYVRAHYGERRFEPEYVQRVRDAWLAIRTRQEQADRS